MTARISDSRTATLSAASSAVARSRSNALSEFGRFNVRVITAPVRSVRTRSLSLPKVVTRSLPRKFWLAFFQESTHALTGIVAGEQQVEAAPLKIEPGIQTGVERFQHRFLGEPYGERRLCGDHASETNRLFQVEFCWDHAGDQSGSVRFRRGHHAAGEDQFHCASLPDCPHQPLRSATSGDEP